MTALSFQDKYDAFINKDSSFEGLCVMAVKTTGIFCRPLCSARKPKPENVEFFNSNKDALCNGYRPCKVCKPLEPLGLTPDNIQELITKLHNDPYRRIKDKDIRNYGIDPVSLRRWFLKHHNMTFQAYQRLYRINHAYRQMSSGNSVTASAFDSGYESLSAFTDQFISIFGKPPTKAGEKSVINITRITTPLGPLFACANDRGISLVEFTDRRMLETNIQALRKRRNAVILPGPHPLFNDLEKQMAEYFSGKRQLFDLPLDNPGTDFQQTVWKMLHTIGYGETISYQMLAQRIGSPGAVRAVANANGHNRIAIINPCHRVIGKDGTLTGYGGGLERKRWLLDHERQFA